LVHKPLAQVNLVHLLAPIITTLIIYIPKTVESKKYIIKESEIYRDSKGDIVD